MLAWANVPAGPADGALNARGADHEVGREAE